MSTFPAKKTSSERSRDEAPGYSSGETDPQIDTMTTSRIALVVGLVSLLLVSFLFAEANSSGLWREFVVSAAQILVTGTALIFFLRPRT